MVGLSRVIAGQTIEVRTHDEPHLDELFALWLAERFGTTAWVAEFCPNGLALGIEGGPFDDHARRSGVSGNGHGNASCTMLVANSLPLNDEDVRDLKRSVEYVHRVDTQGGCQSFDLNALVRALNVCGTETERVIALTFEAFDAFYEQQRDFQDALRDIRALRGIEIHLVREARGDAKPPLFLVGKSDRRALMAAAMHLYKDRLLAVVLKRSTGHVAILSNQAMKFPLWEVVREVRIAELERRDIPFRQLGLEKIYQAGTLTEVPEWFYFGPAQQMLNGSWSHPEVPATGLPLRRIVNAVRRGLCRQLELCEPRPVTR